MSLPAVIYMFANTVKSGASEPWPCLWVLGKEVLKEVLGVGLAANWGSGGAVGLAACRPPCGSASLFPVSL